jgi:hypothetical protein
VRRARKALSRELKKEIVKMKVIVSLILCLTIPAMLVAGDTTPNYTVKYDGGSLQNLKAGSDVKLFIESNTVKFVKDKKEIASIPASAITEISYGQDVHRRVGTAVAVGVVSFGIGALTALSKSKKHFVGLTWVNGDQKGGLAIQCDKDEYRGILAGLEGVSGKKAVDSTTMNVKN